MLIKNQNDFIINKINIIGIINNIFNLFVLLILTIKNKKWKFIAFNSFWFLKYLSSVYDFLHFSNNFTIHQYVAWKIIYVLHATINWNERLKYVTLKFSNMHKIWCNYCMLQVQLAVLTMLTCSIYIYVFHKKFNFLASFSTCCMNCLKVAYYVHHKHVLHAVLK